ncbi:unnamed protein product [Ectocarpus fasciculatus]
MSSEQDFLYQRKYAVSSDGDHSLHGDISAGGMSNKNTEWMQNSYTGVMYVLFIATIWGVVHMTQIFSVAKSTTLVNVVHGLITFYFFHWTKGSPDEFTQGEWNGLTFWEQLDAGVPWTKTKKFMMIVPTVLCLIPLVVSDYQPRYLAVNLPVCCILLLAKSPLMHRVRILDINATTGIDDRVKKE